MWFLGFPLSMQFFDVFFHYFSLPFFGFLLVFVWTFGFSSGPSSKTTSFIHISIVSLFPLITFSFVENCSIGSFHKTMSKDNIENNYSSTNYVKIIIKFLIKKNKKKHLQANGFKGLEKICKVTLGEEPLVAQTWDQIVRTIKRKVERERCVNGKGKHISQKALKEGEWGDSWQGYRVIAFKQTVDRRTGKTLKE
jgi:hypothetical protein